MLKSIFTLGFVAGLFGWLALPTLAQIIPDASLGTESSRLAPANTIAGGAQRGTTLFHSFSEFNIGNGQRIDFANPTGVDRIFTRVTGNHRSEIFGTLGVLGNANLFLINPNGILFGPNARLDIRGSFTASTTSSVQFADERESSNPQAAPLLTVHVPLGLQSGGAAIVNQGNLSAGQDLTLQAERLDLQGQLQAGRDLTLQASDTVQIRDSLSTPFLAQAGRNLTVQGDRGIDILALNHLPDSALVSGGNLSLISDRTLSTDAHFSSGGNLVIRTRSQQPGSFRSLFDPVFSVGGDYSAGDYEGASLQVNAGGNIDYGAVTITAIDPAVHPTQPAIFLTAGGSITGTGTITTLDSRLLVDLQSQGDISTQAIYSQGGDVRLTSKAGSITTNGQLIDTSTGFGILSNNDGGQLTLTAKNNIATGILSTTSAPFTGTAGNGGAIRLDAGGHITADALLSYAAMYDFGASAGIGGAIQVSTVNGDITVETVDTSSVSNYGDARSAGAIALTTENGSIIAKNLSTASLTLERTAVSGTGGAVQLRAPKGQIETFVIETLSRSAGGQGGAGGNIRLEAAGDISTSAVGALDASGVTGRGDIAIATRNGNLNLPFIRASGGGNGGNITLTKGSGTLTLIDSLISSDAVNPGNGGQIQLNAEAVSLVNTEVTATASSRGNAGQIRIVTPGLISLDRSRLFTSLEQGAIGTGGLIQLQADSIALNNFSLIDTATFAQGNAGTIHLTAKDRISLNNSSLFSLTNGEGDAGNITVQAGGTVRLSDRSSISTTVNPRSTGKGGEILIHANRLELQDGGQILTNTLSQGQAGNITVTAPNGIVIAGAGSDSARLTYDRNRVTQPSATPKTEPNDTLAQAQDIDPFFALDAPDRVNPDVRFSTRIPYVSIAGNFDSVPSGNYSYDVYKFEVTTGTRGNFDLDANLPIYGQTVNSRRLTLYDSKGNALARAGITPIGGQIQDKDGDPSLRYVFSEAGTYFIELRRFESGLNVGQPYRLQVSLESPVAIGGVSTLSAGTSGTGAGGNLNLRTNNLTVRDRAQVTVSSQQNAGQAGNLEIVAPSILLNNQGKLIAETTNGNGGNITLQGVELLQLRRNSSISTSAGTAQAGGNGGNIKINSRLIVSVPTENSDIRANAFTGKGGNVEITTQGLFGIGFQPSDTAKSDITASSQFGINGIVTINLPELNPIQGTSELPTRFSAPAIAPGCQTSSRTSHFVNRGRGGVSPSPADPLVVETLWQDWELINPHQAQQTPSAIVEAQSWIKQSDGTVELVAQSNPCLGL